MALAFCVKRALELSAKDFARQVTLLAQSRPAPSGVTVRDVIGYGRHPYRSRWRSEDPDGNRAIAWAMEVTGVESMTHRPVDELSGGELQRVWLATCLAQDTRVFLLDEPTTYLDLRYQVEILDLMRDLADQHGVASPLTRVCGADSDNVYTVGARFWRAGRSKRNEGPGMTEVDIPARIDGRTARAARTRAAIVDAQLALIAEGDYRPTGERIADRAGVSLRALWTNFKDMETLFAASGERVMEQVREAHRPIDPLLPLDDRVGEFSEQRAHLLELISHPARAAQMMEPVSAQLRRNRLDHIEFLRHELTQLFAGELSAAGEESEQLLQALVSASMWPTWTLLRDALGLDVAQARGVMRRTIVALLEHAAAR